VKGLFLKSFCEHFGGVDLKKYLKDKEIKPNLKSSNGGMSKLSYGSYYFGRY
jgi:hypothetical protein